MTPVAEIRRARALLGTIVEISAKGPDVESAIEAAFAEIALIHRLMSFHEAGSDVSRINRASLSGAIVVDERTYEVISFAEKLSRLSGGAFDITIAGSLVEAGFLPEPDDAGHKPSVSSFRDVVLLAENKVLRKAHAWIDLGGVAKGYAVDRAVMVLRANGATSGVVNAGGDMLIFGEQQPVHIRHPFDPTQLYSIGFIADSAVASSSGCYSQKTSGAESIDPVVDPNSKSCVSWQRGVTVLAPSCMAADALTKVVRLASENTLEILAAYQAQAMLVDGTGVYLLAEKTPEQDAGFIEECVK